MHKQWDRKLTKHKALEVEIGIANGYLHLGAMVSVLPKDADHMGVYAEIGLGIVYVGINLYDIRHKEDYDED